MKIREGLMLLALLTAALQMGSADAQVFGASKPITGAEAGLLVQNALDLTVSTAAGKETDGELPVWAESAVTAMNEIGIELDPMAELTREHAAGLLYQVSQLSRSIPNSEVY